MVGSVVPLMARAGGVPWAMIKRTREEKRGRARAQRQAGKGPGIVICSARSREHGEAIK